MLFPSRQFPLIDLRAPFLACSSATRSIEPVNATDALRGALRQKSCLKGKIFSLYVLLRGIPSSFAHAPRGGSLEPVRACMSIAENQTFVDG